MPNRTIRLHEVTMIKENSDKVQDTEGLFYEHDNMNSVICFFIQTDENGYIMGYDKINESWIQIGSFEEKSTQLQNSTDNVISWIEDIYGSDGYGVYGIYDSKE